MLDSQSGDCGFKSPWGHMKIESLLRWFQAWHYLYGQEVKQIVVDSRVPSGHLALAWVLDTGLVMSVHSPEEASVVADMLNENGFTAPSTNG